MGELARRCTECGEPLSGQQRYTCSDACRSKRSRRQARNRKPTPAKTQADQDFLPLARPGTRGVNKELEDVARDVMREELQPIVREAITEDALRAIQKLIALTPTMVERLSEDLGSEDAVTRQRAYTLGLRYTIGHQAIVKPEPEEKAQQQLVVVFGASDGDDTYRGCSTCGQQKPGSEFVGASDRCQSCYDTLRTKAYAQLEDDPQQGVPVDVHEVKRPEDPAGEYRRAEQRDQDPGEPGDELFSPLGHRS